MAVLRGWGGWRFPQKQEEVVGGVQVGQIGELAAFRKEIKAQEAAERISRKLSKGFHANVIYSENGSPLRSREKP